MAYATEESVQAAIADLERQGVRPSVPKIRERLGGGSNTTIHRLLTQARSTAREAAETAVERTDEEGAIPSPLHESLNALGAQLQQVETQAAKTLANELARQAHRLRKAHALEVEHLERQLADSRAENADQASSAGEVCEQLDLLDGEMQAARQELDRERAAKGELQNRLDALESHLAQARHEADRAIERAKAAEDVAEVERKKASRADDDRSRALADREAAIAAQDRAANALDELREELRRAENNHVHARSAADALADRLEAANAKVVQLEAQTDQAERRAREAEAARDKTAGERDVIRAERDTARDDWAREREQFLQRLDGRQRKRTTNRNGAPGGP